MAAARLEAAARAARDWLTHQAAPLWSTAGFDAVAGQFVEALTLDGEPVPAPRRALVQARQIYFACVCGRLGWEGPWADRATTAADRLLAQGRTDSGDWVFSFAADGGVADARSDLYTQAFVIFGLAEAGQALGRTDFIAAAEETARGLDQRWTDAGGGFREGDLQPLPRRQNPHMHLLEAYLALHAATGTGEHLARADAMAELYLRRLRLGSGRLAEFFEGDWRPLAPAELSPGHHFEWAWLLDQLRRAGGRDLRGEANALFRFGESHGVNAAGFAVDALAPDGAVTEGSARLWPQTERLKAALARGDETAALSTFGALQAYLDQPTRGLWTDTRLEDGAWKAGPAPASSGYHIACAIECLVGAAGLGRDLAWKVGAH